MIGLAATIAGAAVCLGGLGGLSAAAADNGGSAWADALHSRARLVEGGQIAPGAAAGRAALQSPALLAGLAIELDPGWKTYWRAPADGIPPYFDWSGSQNLSAIKLLWPAPRAVRDKAGAYVAYKHNLVFPLIVTPKDPNKPVLLRLALNYAVCHDICVPVEARLEAPVSAQSDSAPARAQILGALADVPQKQALGDCAQGPHLVGAKTSLAAKNSELVAEIAYPDGAREQALFVEATGGYYLPLAKKLAETAVGRTRFSVDLGRGGDAASLRGKKLTLTMVSDKGSCEISVPVK